MKPALAVAVLALLAGCSAQPERSPATDPTPSSAPSTQPGADQATEPVARPVARAVRLPVLVGTRLRDVRVQLDELGLEVDVRRRAMCAPGVVLAQDPAPAAKVEQGTRVRLVVAQVPPAASCIVPPGRHAVRDLQRWSAGEGAAPAFADRVRLLAGNAPQAMLTATEALDRSRWVLAAGYAERSDIRLLDVLAAGPMREARVPPLGCVGRGPMSPDLVRRLPWSWSLVTRDAEVRACMDVTAVQVWVDADGGIADVNLLMGSP